MQNNLTFILLQYVKREKSIDFSPLIKLGRILSEEPVTQNFFYIVKIAALFDVVFGVYESRAYRFAFGIQYRNGAEVGAGLYGSYEIVLNINVNGVLGIGAFPCEELEIPVDVKFERLVFRFGYIHVAVDSVALSELWSRSLRKYN